MKKHHCFVHYWHTHCSRIASHKSLWGWIFWTLVCSFRKWWVHDTLQTLHRHSPYRPLGHWAYYPSWRKDLSGSPTSGPLRPKEWTPGVFCTPRTTSCTLHGGWPGYPRKRWLCHTGLCAANILKSIRQNHFKQFSLDVNQKRQSLCSNLNCYFWSIRGSARKPDGFPFPIHIMEKYIIIWNSQVIPPKLK